jgi:hypothetical protein
VSYWYVEAKLSGEQQAPSNEQVYKAAGLLYFIIAYNHKDPGHLALSNIQSFDVYRNQWEKKLPSSYRKLNIPTLWARALNRVQNLKFALEKGIPSVRSLRETIRKGSDRRNWYEHAPRKIQEYFGNDADVFMSFLVHLSPGNRVIPNTKQALKAFIRWKKGESFSAFGKSKALGRPDHTWNLERTLKNDPEAGGPKLYNFHNSLKGHDDAVTVDRWIMRALGLDAGDDVDARLSKGDYETLAEVIRYLTKDKKIRAEHGKDLKPRQTMAMIWAGMKREKEGPLSDVRSYDEALDAIFSKEPALKNQVLSLCGLQAPDREHHYEAARPPSSKLKKSIGNENATQESNF